MSAGRSNTSSAAQQPAFSRRPREDSKPGCLQDHRPSELRAGPRASDQAQHHGLPDAKHDIALQIELTEIAKRIRIAKNNPGDCASFSNSMRKTNRSDQYASTEKPTLRQASRSASWRRQQPQRTESKKSPTSNPSSGNGRACCRFCTQIPARQ